MCRGILAAAIIGSDPKSFGFDLLSEDEVWEKYDRLVVRDVTSLDLLAGAAGSDTPALRWANTEIAADAVFTPCRNFPLYVPKERGLWSRLR
jgi:hypothetical protein